MCLQFAFRAVEVDFLQLFKAALFIQPKIFSHGGFRHPSQFGNHGMRQIVAFQPQNLHAALDKGDWMMIPLIVQGFLDLKRNFKSLGHNHHHTR